MNASELVSDLTIRIYEPPLASYRDDGRISDTSNPLSVVMLLIDYETECSMNGIIGYLGNSSGQRLPETIDALRRIGCPEHASTLKQIQATAASGGMTYAATQLDRAGLTPFSITTFTGLHGDKWNDVSDFVDKLHDSVDWDAFWNAMVVFVGNHMEAIQRQM